MQRQPNQTTTLALTALIYVFLRRTALGIAIQAASQNQLAAYLSGIRVKRVTTLVWALAGGLSALCGLLLAPVTLVDIGLWFVVLKALAALVLGGFGSVPGAIVGGVLAYLIAWMLMPVGPPPPPSGIPALRRRRARVARATRTSRPS